MGGETVNAITAILCAYYEHGDSCYGEYFVQLAITETALLLLCPVTYAVMNVSDTSYFDINVSQCVHNVPTLFSRV